jgi:hypothetical protein
MLLLIIIGGWHMKYFLKNIPFGLAMILFCTLITYQADAKGIDWTKFSKGLNEALQSQQPGLQKSAMRLVIKYGGENLRLKESLNAVVEFYDNASDNETKALALLTVYQIDRKKAMQLVVNDLELETDKMREVIEKLRAEK